MSQLHISYPPTLHLKGSKYLDGYNSPQDISHCMRQDTSGIDFSILNNSCTAHNIIIEEKMDGIGLGIYFEQEQIYVQQRGHSFSLDNLPWQMKNFALWVNHHLDELYYILQDKYVLFGEWLEHKHTVFYDNLPQWFIEYDIYDRKNQQFLSTEARIKLLSEAQSSMNSARVIATVHNLGIEQVIEYLNLASYAKTDDWQENLAFVCQHKKLDSQSVLSHTLNNQGMEGLYIKTENSHHVTGRYKFIRQSFMNLLLMGFHWKEQSLIDNLYAEHPLQDLLRVKKQKNSFSV